MVALEKNSRWLAASGRHFSRLKDFSVAALFLFDVLETFVTAPPRKSLSDAKNTCQTPPTIYYFFHPVKVKFRVKVRVKS